jgi:uncharacterized protein (DUF924 family)
MSRAEEILTFWFGSATGDAPPGDRFKLWFQGGEDVDRTIRAQFGADVERARSGALQSWATTARGSLALIVLIDQFSRNLYRGSGEAFAKDDVARELTLTGLANGFYDQLGSFEQMFFLLPLGHSESLEHQDRALALCEAWVVALPAALKGLGEGALQHARQHRDVIARFGRFPTRNAALGRKSTPEEEAHIAEAKAAGRPV